MANNKKEFKYKGKETQFDNYDSDNYTYSSHHSHHNPEFFFGDQESCFESAGTDSTSDINLNLLLGNKNGQNKES